MILWLIEWMTRGSSVADSAPSYLCVEGLEDTILFNRSLLDTIEAFSIVEVVQGGISGSPIGLLEVGLTNALTCEDSLDDTIKAYSLQETLINVYGIKDEC